MINDFKKSNTKKFSESLNRGEEKVRRQKNFSPKKFFRRMVFEKTFQEKNGVTKNFNTC